MLSCALRFPVYFEVETIIFLCQFMEITSFASIESNFGSFAYRPKKSLPFFSIIILPNGHKKVFQRKRKIYSELCVNVFRKKAAHNSENVLLIESYARK